MMMPDAAYDQADPDAQRRALQVLVLAQRTADEHVASAQHQAENIMAGARASAEQVAREAQAHADGVRREAAQALNEARAQAEQIVREAQGYADNPRRDADKVLTDARAGAQEIGKEAQANADRLDREAQQRYDDVVGSLAAKRDLLQQQIDGLQQFDRDYRSRLRSFMERQLRALGSDEPPPVPEIPQPAVATAGAGLVGGAPDGAMTAG
jgi:cell division septum initiation protein DivIVA